MTNLLLLTQLPMLNSVQWMEDVSLCLSLVLVGVLSSATYCDLRSLKIPNSILLAGFLSASGVLLLAPLEAPIASHSANWLLTSAAGLVLALFLIDEQGPLWLRKLSKVGLYHSLWFLIAVAILYVLVTPYPAVLCATNQTDAFAGALICGSLALVLWNRGGMGGGDVKLAALLGLILGAHTGIQVFLWTHFLAAACMLPAYCWRRFLLRQSTATPQIPMAGFFAAAVVLGAWL